MKISRRSLLKTSAAVVGSGALPRGAIAQATGPDALKSTLTPLGGIRAGNADGSIPAWTGEMVPEFANYQLGEPLPSPFTDDKPLFRITPANVSQYQDKLSAGAIYMLQNHPDYYMDIYPTRRTAVAPQYVYDYTYKNASTAQLSADGNSLSGAYGGTPFPIPTNGKQVIWNHELRWLGANFYSPVGSTFLVTSTGQVVVKNTVNFWAQFPYYFKGEEASFNGTYSQITLTSIAPAYMEGESELVLAKMNPLSDPPRGWEYLLGERRVRLAPQLQYDTPVDQTGGLVNWDEAQMFNGALDRYDCQLVGKKELFVGYNNNYAWTKPTPTMFGQKFVDPSIMRWELHRVWQVEMTLAPGKRNVDFRRTAYVDEDSWGMLACDVYDANNQLWKYFHAVSAFLPGFPCVSTGYLTIVYDFHAGQYVSLGGFIDSTPATRYQPIPRLPDSFFTPAGLTDRAGGS